MMDQWHAVYRTATGELVSVGTVLADPMPAGLSVLSLAGEPDAATHEWDAALLAFVPHPPEV